MHIESPENDVQRGERDSGQEPGVLEEEAVYFHPVSQCLSGAGTVYP